MKPAEDTKSGGRVEYLFLSGYLTRRKSPHRCDRNLMPDKQLHRVPRRRLREVLPPSSAAEYARGPLDEWRARA